MKRRIVHIAEEKCTGCGLCAAACHEGAIGMVNGKAKLLRDDYCDGLGDCLPACPAGAITFEEREALPYDRTAVEAKMRAEGKEPAARHAAGGPAIPAGCPGARVRTFAERPGAGCPGSRVRNLRPAGEAAAGVSSADTPSAAPARQSRLRQWPVQIKLVPVQAPFFDGARLLIAADCTAYAYANFHEDFIRGHVTLIGCPKLDEGDYAEKLEAIFANNTIKSITVVRMEVPCCGGLEQAVIRALQASGKMIPWQVVTLSTDGTILDRT
ncbi:MAG: ATP-binding protein [Succiniclasticum sp.]|jgi:ferredoxin